MKKLKIIGIILFICTIKISFGQTDQHINYNKGLADSLWQDLNKDLSSGIIDTTLGYARYSASEYLFNEVRAQKFREKGLEFWKLFPADSRRFDWFLRAVGQGSTPKYWVDLISAARLLSKNSGVASFPIYREAMNNWDQAYPRLRAEFLQTPYLDQKAKLHFVRLEFQTFLNLNTNSFYRLNGRIDLNKLAVLFINACEQSEQWEVRSGKKFIDASDPLKLMEGLMLYPSIFGLEAPDVLALLQRIDSGAKSAQMKNWVKGKISFLKLSLEPFQFKSKSITGKTMSLEQYKGKVVLIDFWATWCVNCIRLMPKLKILYDKYKDQGFEVLSVTVDTEDKLQEVINVEHRIGADWPTFIIGGKNKAEEKNSLYKEIWKKYSLFGVPVMLVLAKDGKLIGTVDDFYASDFEQKLKSFLKQPYEGAKNSFK